MPLTFEMLVKIETNLKLNLIEPDGKSLIPENKTEKDEVHFLKFEANLQTLDVSLGQIFRLLREFLGEPNFEFKDWTITDIDNHLKGNPHCEE